MKGLTKLQAGACWTGSYRAVLRDTSCANKKPGWRSPHAAALRVLLMPQLLTSLQRFVASLRPIAAVSLLAWVSHQEWSARMCPFIPSWTLPDVSTKDIILTHTYSVQTAVARRLRIEQYSCHRDSGKSHGRSYNFESLSSCHWIFLSSSLFGRSLEFSVGHRIVRREYCRVFCAATLSESSKRPPDALTPCGL